MGANRTPVPEPARRKLGLIGGACCDQVGACGNGAAGFPARCVLNAALPARVHDLQQLAQRIQASGKADVGVQLHQDLPGVTDSQARIQPLVQRGISLGISLEAMKEAIAQWPAVWRERVSAWSLGLDVSGVLIAHFFHPVDAPAVDDAGHRQVGHRRVGRGPVPMLDARRAPHDVARANDLHRLDPTPVCDPHRTPPPAAGLQGGCATPIGRQARRRLTRPIPGGVCWQETADPRGRAR